ncbi:MAG TPA: hypothetical protein VGC37_02895 [Friedmanniella sp.]
MILGLLAAAGASVGYGVATVMQAVGARRAGGLAAFGQPLVLGGLALDGTCFLLSLLAFARLPLFVVETIIAASLVVVVLLARPVLRVPLRRADIVAVVVVLVGLTALAAAAGGQPPIPAAGAVVRACLVGVVVLAAVTAACYRRGPAWIMGLASALGYSGVAIGARGAHTGGPLIDVVRQPMAVVVVASGLIAVVAYVRAIERGPVSLAAALVAVVEVVLPGAVGLAFLGDTVRAGWALPAAAAVLAALVGCVTLARSPANEAAGG